MDGRFEKAGVKKPENWEDMEQTDKQAFMQENDMGRKQMKKGDGRRNSELQGKRRERMGEDMNEQRKETLRQRFQNWMGR